MKMYAVKPDQGTSEERMYEVLPKAKATDTIDPFKILLERMRANDKLTQVTERIEKMWPDFGQGLFDAAIGVGRAAVGCLLIAAPLSPLFPMAFAAIAGLIVATHLLKGISNVLEQPALKEKQATLEAAVTSNIIPNSTLPRFATI